jgi:hypothetical protein
MVIRRIKHLFRDAMYNPVTGAHENSNGKYDSYSQARKSSGSVTSAISYFKSLDL